MNGSGDVFEDRPHLQRMGELSGELGHVRSHRLDAEHAMVVASGEDAHESAIVARLHGERAAVGGEGKRPLTVSILGALRLGRKHADR